MTIRTDPRSRALLTSIALSGVGMGVYLLGLGQLLYQLSGSPQAFALILTLQGIGAVSVLPFSGPLVDALDSRRVYVHCGICKAVTVAAVAVTGLTAVPGSVPVIGVGVVLLAVFDNVQRAALFKFTAWHIEESRRARLNGLLNVAIQAGALVGMALLGVILIWGTVAAALFVDSAMALAVAVLMSRVRTDTVERTWLSPAAALRGALPAAWTDWRAMYRRYRGEPAVLGLVVLCAADFVYQSSLSTLIVPLVGTYYGGRGQYVSALEALFALGMIAASLFTRHTMRQGLLPLWGVLQAGSALVLAGASRPAVQFGAVLVAGFANLTSVTWLITSLQNRAGEEEKAKMASLRLLAIGLGTAGLMPLVGHAAQVSLGAGFGTIGVIMLAFTALAALVALGHRTPSPLPPCDPRKKQEQEEPHAQPTDHAHQAGARAAEH
jgi:MFS family permease